MRGRDCHKYPGKEQVDINRKKSLYRTSFIGTDCFGILKDASGLVLQQGYWTWGYYIENTERKFDQEVKAAAEEMKVVAEGGAGTVSN